MSEDPTPHGNERPEAEQMLLLLPFISERATDSVTLDHYDAFASFPMQRSREATNHDAFVRQIIIGERSYTVTLTLASIKRGSKWVGVFPGQREEIIERTLRHMAVQNIAKTRLVEDNNHQTHMSILFTLSALRKTLRKLRHEMTFAQIREALTILSRSILEVSANDSTEEHTKSIASPVFSNLILDFTESDLTGERSYVALCFHPLAKKAIETMAFSPIDFYRLMSLPTSLSRWLAARMSNRYRGVSRDELFSSKGYHISWETIARESGVTIEPRMSNNLDAVRRALKDMSAEYLNPLQPFDEVLKHGPAKGGRRPVIGAVWTLYPGPKQITETIGGNAEKSRKRGKLLKP